MSENQSNLKDIMQELSELNDKYAALLGAVFSGEMTPAQGRKQRLALAPKEREMKQRVKDAKVGK